jgi:hypothetical protein
MKTLVLIVILSLTVLLSGCVEMAWNSEGHIKTQLPTLRKGGNAFFEQTPIESNEIVNYNRPNQNYQFAKFNGSK